ncbi:MAG TPA: DUF2142 domain-containing protein, partial [Actinomycetales bacterium]
MRRARTSTRRHGSRAHWWAVGCSTVLLGAVLAAWALLTPTYRAPDEPMHVSTSLRLAEYERYPAPGRAQMDPAVLASFRWMRYYGIRGRTPVIEQPANVSAAPSMQRLAAPDVARPNTAVDQMTQHPPGYYLYLAGGIRLLGLDALPPGPFVLVLRLLSAALLLPLPWLCLLVAREVGLRPRAAAATTFLPASWMQFTSTSASVNNGTLLVLATSLVLAALVPVTRGRVGVGRAVVVGLAVSLALLTKGFALALLPVVVVAYLVGVRHGGFWRALRGCLVALAFSCCGLWWWLLNLQRYGQLQPKGTLDPAGLPVVRPASEWVGEFGLTWMRTMWVALGWAEGRPSVWLYSAATGLLVLAILVGTVMLRRRLGAALVLHLAWLGPLAIVAAGSYEEFMASGVTRAAQGRYVQTAVVAFAVLVAAAVCRLTRLLPWVPLLVLLAAVGGADYGVLHFWEPAPGWYPPQGRLVAMASWLPGGLTAPVAVTATAVVAALAG